MLCVILVDVDILGLMWLWDLSIDSVAIINLVLAVGLAVDYSCHVAHAFVQMPATPGLSKRQQRQVSSSGSTPTPIPNTPNPSPSPSPSPSPTPTLPLPLTLTRSAPTAPSRRWAWRWCTARSPPSSRC